VSPRFAGSSELGHRKKQRQERRRILIVAEGEQTEPEYFEGLAKYARATGVNVFAAHTVGLGRDPLALVREAIRRRKAADRDEYDEVWCVCDVDAHDTLHRALTEARRNAVLMAVTNPCFELWLLWHYRDYRRVTSKDLLRRALRQHGCVDKHVPKNFSYAGYRDALKRAERSEMATDAYGVPANPGTCVGRVVARIANAGNTSR
jgi:hypothetical protein